MNSTDRAKMPVVCLYHDDCFDGTGAAWAVLQRYPLAQCIAVGYNKPVPLDQFPAGARVFVVDFCYPFEELLALSSYCHELVILDHHVGMCETIERYNEAMDACGWSDSHRAYFDNHKSGALMTWEFMFPELPVPRIIRHISDRDLWLFELEETKTVMEGLGAYPLDLKLWNRLMGWTPQYSEEDFGHPHHEVVDQLHRDGIVLRRKLKVDVERILNTTQRTIKLGDLELPLVNVPRTMVSEALGHLAQNSGAAVGYFDSEHYREFSLRSSQDGPKVHRIAQQYGGNGHAHAAGFKVARTHPLAQV